MTSTDDIMQMIRLVDQAKVRKFIDQMQHKDREYLVRMLEQLKRKEPPIARCLRCNTPFKLGTQFCPECDQYP